MNAPDSFPVLIHDMIEDGDSNAWQMDNAILKNCDIAITLLVPLPLWLAVSEVCMFLWTLYSMNSLYFFT